jgi:uncharacterized membrane protein YeaQ/YmgE (transglycosylase-associated protein family)
MEGFWDALGAVTLILLVLVGLIAGWIAGAIAGRRKGLYLLFGVVGAVAVPFLLAALGLGALAAGGLIAILAMAVAGALLILLVARAFLD